MIFFDLDGTLLDDDRAIAGGLKALTAKYASELPTTPESLATRWRRSLGRHFPRYLAGELSMQEQRRARMKDLFAGGPLAHRDDEQLDRAFAVYLDAYENSWMCFADTMATLASLSHRSLGIISNGDADQQTRKLVKTGLAPLFDVVVFSSDIESSKPDVRIFAEACRRAGVVASEATYVGDSWDVDIAGSLAAGLQPIWVRREQSPPRSVPSSVRVIPSLAALPDVLASLRRQSSSPPFDSPDQR